VALVARSYGGDARQVATHLEWPPAKVQAVLDYAAAYPAEIGAALAENAVGFEGLARMLPEAERLTVPNDDEPSTDEPDQTGVASR
jgi:hypothetical protein